MEDVYTPTEDDFDALAKLVRINSKRMRTIYIDAASKVFAHAVHTDTGAINGLLADIKFAEIEQALNAIWHFYQQVWQLYENGTRPWLQVAAYPYREEVEESVMRQLVGRA
jgi:hypothetical protein